MTAAAEPMDDLLDEFLAEMDEMLEAVDVAIVRFEAQPDDRSTLDTVFRLLHTLKGTCGFLALPRLEAIAHAGETLLELFRDAELAVSSEAVTLILRAIDQIKWLLDQLRRGEGEPAGDDAPLLAELHDACGSPQPETRSVEADGLPLVRPAAAALPPGPPAAEPGHEAEPGGSGTIRVSVELLDQLMTDVSELVLTRNELLKISRSQVDDLHANAFQRLSAITTQVQDTVVKTRMQPIGTAWKKLPRIVRDLANELGKKIDLVLDGEATELDRQVLEHVRDPLTHMVRNAADHGLERPEERLAAGKPATGVITLSAYHEAGCVTIRLTDDGRGLDVGKIRRKAVERGLGTAEEIEGLSDMQAQRLIFAPGFSTAEAVTNLSGRGVGMDVVRANIEQIGGHIDLSSVPGRGMVVTIKIPLTLAIISALIIQSDGECFAAPQSAVLEVVRAGPGAPCRIETIERVRILRLRDQLVPVVSLAEAVGLAGAGAGGGDAGFVLVMRVGDRDFGLLVDAVLETEEIVVKPLARALRAIPLFSGATILGDGSVALILDCSAFGALAASAPAAAEPPRAEGPKATELPARSLLLVRAGAGAPKVVELADVVRLEQVKPEQVQRMGEDWALNHRGVLTPVIALDGVVVASAADRPLLLLSHEGCAFALAVEEILDVREAPLKIELNSGRPGVLGAAIVGGQTVEVIDLAWCAAQARPRYTAAHERTLGERSAA